MPTLEANPELAAEDRRTLLTLARDAIVAAVEGDPLPSFEPRLARPGLRAARGAFVTIEEDGALRGCIGRMDFEQPLWRNVLDAAIGSALDDPRFPPVARGELGAIRLEVSVLDRPVVLPDPALFDPQRQGIVVEKGFRRGVLLPQVAQEYGWDARRTLETVCLKAGLAPDAWRSGVVLKVFASTCFGEETACPEAPRASDASG